MQFYQSEIVEQSKALPGVSFTLHAPTQRRQVEMQLASANYEARVGTLLRKYHRLKKQVEPIEREQRAAFEGQHKDTPVDERPFFSPDYGDEIGLEFAVIDRELVALKRSEKQPLQLQKYLKAIHSLIVGETVVTPDNVLDLAPPEFVDEVCAWIEAVERLTPEQRKNWLSPSTSSAPEGERTSATTAMPAATEAGTGSATAASSTSAPATA